MLFFRAKKGGSKTDARIHRTREGARPYAKAIGLSTTQRASIEREAREYIDRILNKLSLSSDAKTTGVHKYRFPFRRS